MEERDTCDLQGLAVSSGVYFSQSQSLWWELWCLTDRFRSSAMCAPITRCCWLFQQLMVSGVCVPRPLRKSVAPPPLCTANHHHHSWRGPTHYFMMGLDLAEQSWVSGVNRRGPSTQPWGKPVSGQCDGARGFSSYSNWLWPIRLQRGVLKAGVAQLPPSAVVER